MADNWQVENDKSHTNDKIGDPTVGIIVLRYIPKFTSPPSPPS